MLTRVAIAGGLYCVLMALPCNSSPCPATHNCVPDKQTAVRIAEAVLIPVYGEQQIASERPFKARLKGDVWTVEGTLHCPDGNGGVTTNCDGGTAVVKISKIDGRIISMIHYQ